MPPNVADATEEVGKGDVVSRIYLVRHGDRYVAIRS